MLSADLAVVQRENQFRLNEIENRKLEQLHVLLSTFNTQATLIVGFALASLSSDLLGELGSDLSPSCMYKGDRIGVAFLFCITVVSSIAICMTCIGVSFYVIVRSQYSALEVSVRHTVVLVRAQGQSPRAHALACAPAPPLLQVRKMAAYIMVSYVLGAQPRRSMARGCRP